MLDDLSLFVNIAHSGSLKKAAEVMGIPASTVTRRLQNLEQQLNCQLLHRSPRQFVLTTQGESLLEECGSLVRSLEDRIEQVGTSSSQLKGKIKLLAPSDLARGPLSPAWSAFLKQHPDISIEFVLDNRIEDLKMMQADFAIRIGPQQSSALYQKRIASVRTLLVASPDYLATKAAPSKPEALCNHQLIFSSTLKIWQLRHSKKETEILYPEGNARAIVSEIGLAKQLLLDGVGISLLPLSEVYDEIEQGALVQVLPGWQGQMRDMYIIWPGGKRLNRRSKMLIECLKALVKDSPRFN